MKDKTENKHNSKQLNILAVSGSYKGKAKPQLEDFYDTSDPRGCSSSEYNDYQNAVYKWEVDNNYR
jgi:hypothetical protein